MCPALQLRLPNVAASAGVARPALLEHIATHALTPVLVYRLELVLEEALMNRQWHAWHAGGQHDTALKVRVTADAVEMCFEDDGVAFDPLQVAPAPRPASLDDAVPGGLGLMLMRRAATACHYARVDGRNRWTLPFARPVAASPEAR